VHRLDQRQQALMANIAEERRRIDNEALSQLDAEVGDQVDQAFVMTSVEMERGLIDRYTEELEQIAAVRERLANGVFGQCLDCGEPIGFQYPLVELGTGLPSFTSGTLEHFHDRGFAPTELCFLIGADAFVEIESWKDFPAILDRAHFAVVSRSGFPVADMSARLPALARRMTGPSEVATRTTPSIFLIDAPTANVSATAIRQRSANGESIVGLVPPAVGQHIERHALYSTAAITGVTGMRGALGSDTHRPPAAGRLHGQN